MEVQPPKGEEPPRDSQKDTGDPAKYAGFWKRFVAVLIDTFIITVVSIICGFMLGIAYGLVFQTNAGAEVVGRVLGTVLGWLYFAGFESSRYQATIGKHALNIKVTDMDGGPISFATATGRHFGKIISTVTIFIGFLMAGFTEKKQALHDKMASCLVVTEYDTDVTV